MTAWEDILNGELSVLNEAYSAARMDVGDYRRRRRALLNAALRAQASASHTIRRPAAAQSLAVGGRLALPMRRAAGRPSHQSSSHWWWLAGALLALVAWLAATSL